MKKSELMLLMSAAFYGSHMNGTMAAVLGAMYAAYSLYLAWKGE